ncbi:MAG: DUF4430 domain-containing protein, partial [Clostridiales bacterium]|nr:DUF4430 domain-containing protein [Clostridiales bacterium]
MKKIVSKFMLFIFMFIQVFSIIPKQVYANAQNIEVVVQSNQGIIAKGETTKTNALDALDDVLKSKSISYTAKDSQWGGKYISEINNLKEGDLGQSTGWMYAIQRDGKYEIPMNSIDATTLEQGDR